MELNVDRTFGRQGEPVHTTPSTRGRETGDLRDAGERWSVRNRRDNRVCIGSRAHVLQRADSAKYGERGGH